MHRRFATPVILLPKHFTAEDAVKSIQTSRCNTAIEDFLGRRRLLDGLAVRSDAGPDRATAGSDGIDGWWSSRQRNPSTAGCGVRTGVAKVGRKWCNFGYAGSESRAVGGDSGMKLSELTRAGLESHTAVIPITDAERN